MNRVRKVILVSLLAFIMGLNPIYAKKCDFETTAELNKKSSKIKVNYDIKTYKDSLGDEIYYFQVNVLNLSPEFYIKVTNNQNSDSKIIDYSMVKDGLTSFDWKDLSKVTDMKFSIYSSSKTNCKDNVIRSTSLRLPRFNRFASYNVCSKYPEYYMCKTFVTTKEISGKEFNRKIKELEKKRIEKEQEKANNNSDKTIISFFKKYWYIVLIVILLVGGSVYAYLNRDMLIKRGKNEKKN